ncbi:class I SAM-dependent methyltransferase [Tateyamaria sp. SN6-1]|uniref:class I SAM-dependent methyltransferase n=1 Tax=Tateyamaria sp. SN6-1 TaxID=3092148 RepID=UPI0039F643AA
MTNADQQEFWTSAAGPRWVALQAEMDALLGPVLDAVMTRAALIAGARVLDVGCGTGDSVARIADAVGATGHVTGADISQTMLQQARDQLGHLPQVTLTLADVQSHQFETPFDAILSRFGVMFFDDTVAAFANLWATLAPGGHVVMAAWGPAPDNPWFMEPASAARAVLGPMPKVDRTLPGPFAFEDADRVVAMMQAAGMAAPAVETLYMDLTPTGTVEEAAALCCDIGPADSALKYFDASDQDRAAVRDAIAARFAPFDGPEGLRIPACIHLFEARKPS